MVAITMQRGSYKQLQDEAPVFMLSDGKSHYIGIKRIARPNRMARFIPFQIKNKKGRIVSLNKKAARCCFGFYEVCDGQ